MSGDWKILVDFKRQFDDANYRKLVRNIDFVVPESFWSTHRHEKFLGCGGYGIVVGLGASQNVINFAVKKYIKPFTQEDEAKPSPKMARRCFRELQLLRELRHENIVEMAFAYTTDNSLLKLESVYLTTKYCGENLARLISQETVAHHRFTLKCFKRMISELLRALKYINSANVIHRDLKPDNLAIDENGKLTLLDFGLARVVDREHQEITSDPGAKYYRAIETVAFGFQDDMPELRVYNETADIWSIGAILCEMITGVILFKVENKTKEHPIMTAINICGPYPDKVLKKIDHFPSRAALKEKSKKAKRMNFLTYFLDEGRPWLANEITKDGEAIVDFIDRTLNYDHDERMTVDEALGHRFLSSVRAPEKEVIAEPEVRDKLRDVTVDEEDKAKAVEEWKKHIWELVKPAAQR